MLANDTDGEGEPRTTTSQSDVTNGTLALNTDGSFNYTPNANFTGVDSFTYVANDCTSDSLSTTVTLTISG